MPLFLLHRVDESNKVVIGDFGLAKDIYCKDYYSPSNRVKPVPIKWMAIESLDHSRFTIKSDVVGCF